MLNNDSHLEFLSPKLYATFANNTYYETKVIPPDWGLFVTCPEHLQCYGYYGELYIKVDEQNKKVTAVFAHRGTDNTYGEIIDLELLLKMIPEQYLKGAKPFIVWALQELDKKYPSQKYARDIHVTGHSLGATIGEISCSNSEHQMKGMIFESPGSIPLIEELVNEKILPPDALAYAKKHLQCIYTSIDAVNTLMPTAAGTVNQILLPIRESSTYPGIFIDPWPAVIPNPFYYVWGYSFKVEHPMKDILKYFDTHHPNDILPVENWPVGFWEGYRNYVTYPEKQHLTPEQRHQRQYWNGYIFYLWNDCSILSDILRIVFFDNFQEFHRFFKHHLLYQQQLAEQHINPSQRIIEQPISLCDLLSAREIWNEATKIPHSRICQQFENQQQFIDWYEQILARDKHTRRLEQITHQLLNIQVKFKHVSQDPQRKQAINYLIDLCREASRPGSQLSIAELERKIRQVRDEIQESHEAKYDDWEEFGIFFPEIFRSRTVRELDKLMQTFTPVLAIANDIHPDLVMMLTENGPRWDHFYNPIILPYGFEGNVPASHDPHNNWSRWNIFDKGGKDYGAIYFTSDGEMLSAASYISGKDGNLEGIKLQFDHSQQWLRLTADKIHHFNSQSRVYEGNTSTGVSLNLSNSQLPFAKMPWESWKNPQNISSRTFESNSDLPPTYEEHMRASALQRITNQLSDIQEKFKNVKQKDQRKEAISALIQLCKKTGEPGLSLSIAELEKHIRQKRQEVQQDHVAKYGCLGFFFKKIMHSRTVNELDNLLQNEQKPRVK